MIRGCVDGIDRATPKTPQQRRSPCRTIAHLQQRAIRRIPNDHVHAGQHYRSILHMNQFLDGTTICGLRELTDPVGHTHILSLIDPEWPEPREFRSWRPDRWLLQRFHDDIQRGPQRVLPTREDVADILAFGRHASNDSNARLFIHCLSGKSRSTAAAVMIWAQAVPKCDEVAIIDHLIRMRPEAWPNSLMIQYADELLGRGGRLIEAVRELYKRGIAANPDWVRSLERMGRGEEAIR